MMMEGAAEQECRPEGRTMVSLLRLQLERVHKRLGAKEAELFEERRERQQLEEEVEQLRAIEQLSEATPASKAARQLVEAAVAKAMASKREAESLRAELEAERASRVDESDASSLRRALHNLSASFDQQERYLKSSLDESTAELERRRKARLKCAGTTQRLAETLRELMIELSNDEDDLEDDASQGHHHAEGDATTQQHHHHYDEENDNPRRGSI